MHTFLCTHFCAHICVHTALCTHFEAYAHFCAHTCAHICVHGSSSSLAPATLPPCSPALCPPCPPALLPPVQHPAASTPVDHQPWPGGMREAIESAHAKRRGVLDSSSDFFRYLQTSNHRQPPEYSAGPLRAMGVHETSSRNC